MTNTTACESFGCTVDLSAAETPATTSAIELATAELATTLIAPLEPSAAGATVTAAASASDGPANTSPEESNDAPNGFVSFGFMPEVLQAVASLGYKEPTPIQQAAIPELMLGRDLVGQAQTGTGKTAAFALPMLARMDLQQRTPRCWC